MDFLRHLAPRRESDATRAFAVLPSRFACETPLQTTTAPGRMASHPDDDEARLSPDAASAPAANDTLAAQAHPVTSIPLFRAAPCPLAKEPTPRTNAEVTGEPIGEALGEAISPAYAPVEAPGIPVVNPRFVQDQHAANWERAKPAGPELQDLASTSAATHGRQNVTAPPAQARTALPLSQAILAQRTRQSRDDSQVVHVTIGRIDVVANTAPAPAARGSPVPRQATVTLGDYLRGSHGGRQ